MKQLKLKNLKRDIRASRDEAGVPHVDASSWLDALYGLGYMQASDRGTQMLFARSIANGRAAEEIRDSPEFVETDCFFRRIALYRRLAEEYSLLPANIREQLAAFCAGINDCIEASSRSIAMLATGFQRHSRQAGHSPYRVAGRRMSPASMLWRAEGQTDSHTTFIDQIMDLTFDPRYPSVDDLLLSSPQAALSRETSRGP